MKRSSIILFTFVLISTNVKAQEQSRLFNGDNDSRWQKGINTHRLSQYPKLHPDGRIWFQFNAPKTAQSVKLQIAGEEYVMQKDTNDLWNVIIPGTKPGNQIYNFLVDNVRIIDPGSTPFYSNGYVSILEYPAPEDEYYLIKNVPHGDVREHWFYSQVAGEFRRMFVYTPPGYDQNPGNRYPVLYLQHGAGEMEQEWTHSGLANFILDNLLVEKKAQPMIIVMNNGFVNRPGETGRRSTGSPDEFSAFEEMLIKEVIPDIDMNYRTIADREHRAMAGLSMGSRQTYFIGLNHLDTFSHLGVFSGAMFVIKPFSELPEPLNDAENFNRRVPVFFFSSGTVGSDERICATLKDFCQKAEEAGVKTIFYESKGTQHEWMTWRRSLYQFLPLLFQK